MIWWKPQGILSALTTIAWFNTGRTKHMVYSRRSTALFTKKKIQDYVDGKNTTEWWKLNTI